MGRSRGERRGKQRSERRRLIVAAALVVTGVLIVAVAVAMALTAPKPVADSPLAADVGASALSTEASVISTALPVEVPPVVGVSLAQAEAVLSIAGFDVERRVASTAPADAQRTVLAQEPEAGTLTERGAKVVVVHAPSPAVAVVATVAPKPVTGHIVCIDPGHQRKSDQRPEPVGPGSSETKMRVTGGTTGVSSGKPEYVFTLELSERIRKRLEAAGVRVVMTRTGHDVNISNSERAKVANRAGADLFLRIHADGNTDRSLSGISTLYPATNSWTRLYAASGKRSADAVHASVIKATGATNRGVVARGDLSGFNWATVPSCLVECGFMSNPAEDTLLVSAAYQEKLAAGIAEGVMTYLRGE